MENSGTVKIIGPVSSTTAMLQKELKIKSRVFQSVIFDIGKFRTSKGMQLL